jgi:hypothetical protein
MIEADRRAVSPKGTSWSASAVAAAVGSRLMSRRHAA